MAKSTELSAPLHLAILAFVILNLTFGIIHVFQLLVWKSLPVWKMLPYLCAVLTGLLSWQILLLIDNRLINFGFQLGGLWVLATFILDFFLYIVPEPGPVSATLARLSDQLLLYYGIMLFEPTLIGIIRAAQNQKRRSKGTDGRKSDR